MNNIKITVTCKILNKELIGTWVTAKATSDKSRYLFQKHMSKIWWETDDLGRYCNHSLTPNTTVVFQENQLILKANRKIEYGEEILVDYRKITNYTGYIPTINFKNQNIK
ncbi:SET domain-containing protein-lysine N-methyltransferase [Flavobacterium sp.]|uniref:SET domain-containing protein-lysine N-methyltransferase n=1 Tax=Flavobacterium sp. TaxID=239 RepID=UPI003D122D44